MITEDTRTGDKYKGGAPESKNKLPEARTREVKGTQES